MPLRQEMMLPKPRIVKRFGWKAPHPNPFRKKFSSIHATPEFLPSHRTLRYLDTPIYDQLNLGDCTGNALSGLVWFILRKEKKVDFSPSRLAIYYWERKIENSISSDSGASLSDGMTVLEQVGAPHETMWPYDVAKFDQDPTQNVYQDAALHKATQILSIDNTDIMQIKNCIHLGYPFVLGFTVFESFMNDSVAKTGVVPLPKSNEAELGGHAVKCISYDDYYKAVCCANSWGSNFGDHGYIYLPYEYITNPDLCGDLWTAHFIN